VSLAAPHGYRIRPAAEADLPALPAIERDAAELFRAVGRWNRAYESVRTPQEHAFGLAHGVHWVAAGPGDRPCGFALGAFVDGHLHLLELGVARAHQGRGLSAALVETFVGQALARGDALVTLTTERDIPWNAPFYRRRGFVEVEPGALASELRRMLDGDIAAGLDPATRCAMARAL
jgi:GNAT superfamily N-acetyltransferase